MIYRSRFSKNRDRNDYAVYFFLVFLIIAELMKLFFKQYSQMLFFSLFLSHLISKVVGLLIRLFVAGCIARMQFLEIYDSSLVDWLLLFLTPIDSRSPPPPN